MSSLEEICEMIYNEVQGAIATAVVDLETGLPLAVHHRIEYFSQDYVDLVSAAAVDMFRGRTVRRVEEQLTNHRQKSAYHSIQEVQMVTVGTLHFMMTVPEHPHIVAILVTTKKTGLGLGWASLRSAINDISENITLMYSQQA